MDIYGSMSFRRCWTVHPAHAEGRNRGWRIENIGFTHHDRVLEKTPLITIIPVKHHQLPSGKLT